MRYVQFESRGVLVRRGWAGEMGEGGEAEEIRMELLKRNRFTFYVPELSRCKFAMNSCCVSYVPSPARSVSRTRGKATPDLRNEKFSSLDHEPTIFPPFDSSHFLEVTSRATYKTQNTSSTTQSRTLHWQLFIFPRLILPHNSLG